MKWKLVRFVLIVSDFSTKFPEIGTKMGRRAIPVEFIEDPRRRLACLRKRKEGLINKILELSKLQNDPNSAVQNVEIIFAYRARHLRDPAKNESYFFDSVNREPKTAISRWAKRARRGKLKRIGSVADYKAKSVTITAKTKAQKEQPEVQMKDTMECEDDGLVEVDVRGNEEEVVDSGSVLRAQLDKIRGKRVF